MTQPARVCRQTAGAGSDRSGYRQRLRESVRSTADTDTHLSTRLSTFPDAGGALQWIPLQT